MPAPPQSPMSPETSPPAVTHYENFPVASWLCPKELRAPIAAIYHFARTADDLADEGDASAEKRLQQLTDYRAQLALAAGATPNQKWDPRWASVFAPLAVSIRDHRLPLHLLNDLLDAFVQDVQKTRDRQGYASEAELLDYCRRSANPVGRLLLHLWGVATPQALEQSDAICTALQLINFWQDPGVDLPRGRLYFPQDVQARHNVATDDLWALRQTPEVTRMLAACVEDARRRMLRGAPLVKAVPGRAGWELRMVVQGGLRILDRIEAAGHRTLETRPTLRSFDYALMLWRALWM